MSTDENRQAWYIDSLDARAGLAFASYRAPERSEDWGETGIATVFIEPPHFEAIRVPNRSVGLAAARRSFQLGLFIEDREVAFATLDDVTEFTRRCYTRGAGGDGPDRPQGNGPPAPLEPEPEKPLDERYEGSERLLQLVSAFQSQVSEASRGNGQLFDWNGIEAYAASREADRSTIKFAASILFAELMRRCPVSYSDSLRWTTSVRKLVSLLWRIDVEPLPIVDRILRSATRVPQWLNATSGSRAWLRHQFDVYPIHTYEDPLDLLDAIPVPPSIAKDLGLSKSETVSLSDLLSAFLGSPREVNHDLLSLVLLSAACVVCSAEQPTRYWHGDDHPERFALIIEKAHRWLAEQLPRRAFGKDVEDLIRQASNPSRDPGTGSPVTPGPQPPPNPGSAPSRGHGVVVSTRSEDGYAEVRADDKERERVIVRVGQG